jgi:DNA-binding IclR family transcriptional regulator
VGVCLFASAPGKAMMANVSEQEKNEILTKIEYTPYTDNTITNTPDYLKELERVQSCGYGLDMGERLPNDAIKDDSKLVVACED